MTSVAHKSIGPSARPGRRPPVRRSGCFGLRLRQRDEGWVLVSPDEKLVFQAPGLHGRRRCLEYARAKGVLAIFG
jgi:hypothetical protein